LAGTREVEAAARALRGGELVILPTETVYGLAAAAADPAAVARLFEAKGRPRFNPLIAHVVDLGAAEALVVLEPAARSLAEAFWPGPLTLVGRAREPSAVSDLARAGLDTIAVRAPAHPLAQAVLQAFGGPVAAPSANRSGRPSPTRYADAVEETGAFAAAALDGGPCTVGLESTVVAVLDGVPRLLRPGAVTRAQIEAVAGPLAESAGEAHRSPGRLTLHYAPDAPVRLEAEAPRPGEAYLAFGPWPAGPSVLNLSPGGDLREAAAHLFSHLRAGRPAGPHSHRRGAHPGPRPRRSHQRPPPPRRRRSGLTLSPAPPPPGEGDHRAAMVEGPRGARTALKSSDVQASRFGASPARASPCAPLHHGFAAVPLPCLQGRSLKALASSGGGELLQHVIRRAHAEFSGLLKVQLLHDAVADQHGVALGAHAHQVLDPSISMPIARVKSALPSDRSVISPPMSWDLPRRHDEDVVDRHAGDGVHAPGAEIARALLEARQVLDRAGRRKGARDREQGHGAAAERRRRWRPAGGRSPSWS
jgi:L-threonylcarbamoyladenylate synthase